MTTNNSAVILLAAGKSSRMGFPKSLLKFDEYHSFLDIIINKYEDFGCNEIIVVVNDKNQCTSYPHSQKVIFVTNNLLKYGRFYSIKLGIQQIKNCEYCFIQNIDNPFVTINLLRHLFDKKTEHSYVSPRFKGNGGHPILLGKDIMKAINKTHQKSISFKDILHLYNCHPLEVDNPNILININTPELYHNYFPFIIGD